MSVMADPSIAMHGNAKYSEKADGFPYLNANAPKGGKLRLAEVGSFDSLNPFIARGTSTNQMRMRVFESLMKRGLDEPFTLYPLIARDIAISADGKTITFQLNPKARFSDGKALTSEDVIWTWQTLKDKGRPNHRYYYGQVDRAEACGVHCLRFYLANGDNRELPLILALMPILPKHIYGAEGAFSATWSDPPIGSGPYIVSKVEIGRHLTLTRNPDYWGKNLWTNRGSYNFDEIVIDWFRSDTAAFEAVKSGLVDLWQELDATRWATGYDYPALKDGRQVRQEIADGWPAGMFGLALNSRRAPFDDRQVRQAIIQMFDFAWINKTLFHGLYDRTESFFEKSELQPTGPLSDAECQLLNDYGSDCKTAGGLIERLILTYAKALQQIGMTVKIRTVDSSQFEERRRIYDFDAVLHRWGQSLSPGNEQAFYWGTASRDQLGTRNYFGIQEPLIDFLIDRMVKAESREDLVAATHLLDRILMGGAYVVPLYHSPKKRYVMNARLRAPNRLPMFGLYINDWWFER
ncbi:unnamed protein product [Symbiodinium microadriaticum]|nr:unnamed protein product [Symbiodinium microadriaticum]